MGDAEAFLELLEHSQKHAFHGALVIAFPSKMIDFIMVVEKDSEFDWHNIWIETDSMYVLNLFNSRTGKIPWHLHNRWSIAVINNVTDRLASQAHPLNNIIGRWVF